jgi:outer membrane protein OmpA-like peptidoglycan-associated protein
MFGFDRRELLLATVTMAAGALPLPARAGEADVNRIIRSLAPIRGQTKSEGYPPSAPSGRDAPPPPRGEGAPMAPRGGDASADWGATRREEVEGETVVVVPAWAIDLEVYFEFGSARLTRRTREDLRALGRALASRELAPFRYLIAGHTDGVGDPRDNLDLSRRRAFAVKAHLVDNFPIDPRRLRAVGFGDMRLKRPERPEAAINRRVEVILILPEDAVRPMPDDRGGQGRPGDGRPPPPPPRDEGGNIPGAPVGPDGKPMRW